MTETTFVYCLIDPRNGEIRYVGKADDPEARLRDHLKDRRDFHRVRWIKSLVDEGIKPVLILLEQCSKQIWQERERYWIAFLRENGADLVNTTDGGEGITRHSPEVLAKISAAAKGNKYWLGRKHTVETRTKLSESHKDKPMLSQTREAIAKANIGSDYQRHRADNTMLEYRGVRASIYEWMERFGIGRTVILKRIMRGWSVEDALETPKRPYRKE